MLLYAQGLTGSHPRINEDLGNGGQVSALHAFMGCITLSDTVAQLTEFSIFSDFFYLHMACLDFYSSAVPRQHEQEL